MSTSKSSLLVYIKYVSILKDLRIGSAVSKISGTLVELRAMNESRSRQRREVRVYLSNQDASLELVSRIMRFVEYKLEKTLGRLATPERGLNGLESA